MKESVAQGCQMEDDRVDLLAQVALWYYVDGLDQAAIAERINKSR